MRLGKRERRALTFIKKVNGWHSFDKTVKREVRSLERKGLVEVNQFNQFRPKQEATKMSFPTFKQWMEQVDNWCWKLVGLSVYDLPDRCYRDWYDERVSSETAARRAIAGSY
jgi:hypothetical protein